MPTTPRSPVALASLVLVLVGSMAACADVPQTGRTKNGLVEPTAVRSDVPSPGRWQVDSTLPKVVHLWDIPGAEDQVLACAGSGLSEEWAQQRRYQCYRYNVMTQARTLVDVPVDWFCNGAVHDMNGNIVVAGGTGTDGYPKLNNGTWAGTAATYRYQSSTHEINRLGDMATPRWYPNLLRDQAGAIYAHGGRHEGKNPPLWEVLKPGRTTWETLPWQYPTSSYSDIRLIAPDTGAYTGATSGMSADPRPAVIVDLKTGQQTRTPGLRQAATRREAGSLMVYPAQRERVLIMGGGGGAGTPAVADVDQISYAGWPGTVPSFRPRAPMPVAAVHVLPVNLPNGQVFVTGGAQSARGPSVLWAAFYDPTTNRWTRVAAPTVPRNYHSASRVNLNGTVSVFGGNRTSVSEDRVETYEPWYTGLPRPRIASSPSTATLGRAATISVDLPAGASVGYVTLDGAKAETHSSDPNQRMLNIPFSLIDGGLRLRIPGNASLLPPGMYKLAVNTTASVPSTQVWIKVAPAA